MELLMKAAVAGIVASVLGLVVKKNVPELTLVLALSAAVLVLSFSLSLLSPIKDFLQQTAEAAGISAAVFTPVLKAVGIGVIAKISSDVCKDAGNAAVSSGIELVASAAAICVTIPLMSTVVSMLQSLI